MERVGEDVIIGDNNDEDVGVNNYAVKVGKVEKPRLRKSSERIVKMKLGKKLVGKGSASNVMDID